jgi:hypothetical protein
MPSYFKKLVAQLQEEDFSYVKEIKRPAGFADEMCHNYPKINDLLMYLQTEWEAAKTNDEDLSTYAINRKDTAGIIIKVGQQPCLDLHHYFIDYIKSQLQIDDYILHANKHTAKRISGCTEESWFYFLKAKPTFNEGKFVQRYGNVIVELKKDAKNAIQFKLQCNYYAGFNYAEPIAFDEFLASL